MDKREIAILLPEKPRVGMREYVFGTFKNLLGGEKILFHKERITLPPDYEEALGAPTRSRKRTAARCTCTACESEFAAGFVEYAAAGVKGVRMYMGEDAIYPGYIEPEEPMSVEIASGEDLICPYCEALSQLMHLKPEQSGPVYQLMVGSVETVSKYTAIVTWLFRRHLDPCGIWCETVSPAEAVVISERGQLSRYSHITKHYGTTSQRSCWVPMGSMDDIFMTMYYNRDACMHRQVGGAMWNNIPPMEGATGEKTGLAEYVAAGGRWPIAYLRIWQKARHVENLIKSPWGSKVKDDIDHQVNTHLEYGNRSSKAWIDWADMREAKPHRQLGMTRGEVRALAGKWSLKEVKEWAVHYQNSARLSATEFDTCLREIGLKAMRSIIAYEQESGADECLAKAVRYLKKQTVKGAAEMLVDLWGMLDKAEAEGRNITEEMRWPRNLRHAHDREAAIIAAKERKEAAKKYADGFRAILDKYGALEWTDGELCIRLPRDNGELVAEGDTLRHCVGGYGQGHIDGRTVVFFVRHYRRPERSYYTMDYNLNNRQCGGEPHRHQLHGYGNERHGKNKEHIHKIPQKVKNFCDRWEREVLLPWWYSQQNEKKRSA